MSELQVSLKKLNLFEFLEKNAVSQPGAKAVVGPNVHLSYSELWKNSKKVASYLRQFQLEVGSIIVLALPTEVLPTFIFACLHEGLVVSPHLAGGEGALGIGISAVITNNQRHVVAGAKQILINAESIQVIDSLPEAAEFVVLQSMDSICRIEFSSGTTGLPKAIPISLSVFTKRMQASHLNRQVDQRHFSLASLGNGAGYMTLLIQICAGNAYLVPGSDEQNLNQIRNWPVTCVSGSPAQLGSLAAQAINTGQVLPSLKKLQYLGSSLNPKLNAVLRTAFQPDSITSYYGSAEVFIVVVGLYHPELPGYLGAVAPGAEVQVVDKYGVAVKVGVMGFIRAKTAGIASGYLNDAEASKSAFVDGWFYPGDLGHFDSEGNLFLDGRESDRINAAGKKIDPLALELFAITHGGIEDAAAFAFLDDAGVERLGLAFVCDEVPDIASLHNLLVSEFGFSVPSKYARLAVIPRNETGKIIRSAISEQLEKS